MKKQNVMSLRNNIIVGLIGCLSFGACQKSEKTDETNQVKLMGDWKLSDLTIVNQGDKLPARFREIPRVNDLRFILLPGGKLSSGHNETGSWCVAKDHLQIRFDGEELLDMKIAQLNDRLLVLEQEFTSANGREGGTIYMALAK